MKQFKHIALICIYTAAGLINIAGRSEFSSIFDNSYSSIKAASRAPVLTRAKLARPCIMPGLPEIDSYFNDSHSKCSCFIQQTGEVESINEIPPVVFSGYLFFNKAPPVA